MNGITDLNVQSDPLRDELLFKILCSKKYSVSEDDARLYIFAGRSAIQAARDDQLMGITNISERVQGSSKFIQGDSSEFAHKVFEQPSPLTGTTDNQAKPERSRKDSLSFFRPSKILGRPVHAVHSIHQFNVTQTSTSDTLQNILKGGVAPSPHQPTSKDRTGQKDEAFGASPDKANLITKGIRSFEENQAFENVYKARLGIVDHKIKARQDAAISKSQHLVKQKVNRSIFAQWLDNVTSRTADYRKIQFGADSNEEKGGPQAKLSRFAFQQSLRATSNLIKNDIHDRCTTDLIQFQYPHGGIKNKQKRDFICKQLKLFLGRLLDHFKESDTFEGPIVESDIEQCMPFLYRKGRSIRNASLAESIHLVRLGIRCIESNQGSSNAPEALGFLVHWRYTGIISIAPLLVFKKNPFFPPNVQKPFEYTPFIVVYSTLMLKEGEFNPPVWEHSKKLRFKTNMLQFVLSFARNTKNYVMQQLEAYHKDDARKMWVTDAWKQLLSKILCLCDVKTNISSPVQEWFVFRDIELYPAFKRSVAPTIETMYLSFSGYAERFRRESLDELVRQYRRRLARQTALDIVYSFAFKDVVANTNPIEPAQSTSVYGYWTETLLKSMRKHNAVDVLHKLIQRHNRSIESVDTDNDIPFDYGNRNNTHQSIDQGDILQFIRAYSQWRDESFIPQIETSLDDMRVAIRMRNQNKKIRVNTQLPLVLIGWECDIRAFSAFFLFEKGFSGFPSGSSDDVYRFGQMHRGGKTTFRYGVSFDFDHLRLFPQNGALAKPRVEGRAEGVFYTEKTDSRLFKYAEKYDETSWIHGRYYCAWHPNRYWGTTELPKGFNVSFHPITPGARSIPNTSMNPIQREVVAPSAPLNGVLARYVHRYSSKPATP